MAVVVLTLLTMIIMMMVMMMLMMLTMMMIGEEEKDKDKADQPILFTKSFSSLSLERFIVQVKQPKSEFNI